MAVERTLRSFWGDPSWRPECPRRGELLLSEAFRPSLGGRTQGALERVRNFVQGAEPAFLSGSELAYLTASREEINKLHRRYLQCNGFPRLTIDNGRLTPETELLTGEERLFGRYPDLGVND